MDLKEATLEDAKTIIKMLLQFAASSPYPNLVDFYRIGQLVGSFIVDEDKLAVLCEDKGMLLGITMPFLWGTKKTATEMAWWVEPKYRKGGVGKELINYFHTWAEKKGCSAITLTSLDNSVNKLYDRLGFKLCEQTYIKELGPAQHKEIDGGRSREI
jgi:GNAT superfamily N-acetyltransferase